MSRAARAEYARAARPAAVASRRPGPARAREAEPRGASNQSLQARVRLGGARDPLERQADRAADAVLAARRGPEPGPAPPELQRLADGRDDEEIGTIRRQVEGEQEEEEEELQLKAESGGGRAAGAEVAAGAVAGGGRPLGAAERSYFEPRFGRDLSQVRLHTHPAAAAGAKAIRARAYTLGRDIAFAAGAYRPESPNGRWLLAHELAHVAQQRGGGASPLPVVERDATSGATAALEGRPVELAAAHDGGLPLRFGEPEHVPQHTYIAGQNPEGDGFLTDAIAYHRAWGLRPRTVDSLEDVVNHLAGSAGTLDRIRIVTHASRTNLYMALFENGADGILENELRGVATSEERGMEELLRGGLLNNPGFLRSQDYQTVLDQVRQQNAPVLQPFGLDAGGSQPTGVTERLLRRSADLLAYTVGTIDPGLPPDERTRIQNQQGTIAAALRTALDGLRAEAAQAPPAGAGVTAAEALALQNAVTGLRTLSFPLAEQDADLTRSLAAAQASSPQFYTRLGRVRARFTSGSWVDVRGCRVGGTQSYMEAVAEFFGQGADKPHVSAPVWWQSFPILASQPVADADVAGLAGNADVVRALDHWFGASGVMDRLFWLRSRYFRLAMEIRRQQLERVREESPSPFGTPTLDLRPLPPLPGGLGGSTDALLVLPPLPQIELDPVGEPGGSFGGPTFNLITDDLGESVVRFAEQQLAEVQAEIDRLMNLGTEDRLRYYLDQGLVLPVQEAANVENITLYMKGNLLNRALESWLSSQWAEAAPGLRALRRGGWAPGNARRVAAVSDKDAADQVVEMYVSPDPRYQEQIEKI